MCFKTGDKIIKIEISNERQVSTSPMQIYVTSAYPDSIRCRNPRKDFCSEWYQSSVYFQIDHHRSKCFPHQNLCFRQKGNHLAIAKKSLRVNVRQKASQINLKPVCPKPVDVPNKPPVGFAVAPNKPVLVPPKPVPACVVDPKPPPGFPNKLYL